MGPRKGDSGSSRKETVFQMAVAAVGALMFWTGTAAAIDVSGIATDVCGSDEYLIVAGIFVAFMGLGLIAVVSSGFLSAGVFSLSWVSRSLAKMGASGISKSIGAAIALMFFVFILGLVFGTVSVPIPEECYMPM